MIATSSSALIPYVPVGMSGTVTGVDVTPVVADELPNSFVATIVNVYSVAFVRPSTVQGDCGQVAVNVFGTESTAVTTYTACAPFSLPCVKDTVHAVPVPADGAAVIECGWAGAAPIVIPVGVVADAGPVPSAFCSNNQRHVSRSATGRGVGAGQQWRAAAAAARGAARRAAAHRPGHVERVRHAVIARAAGPYDRARRGSVDNRAVSAGRDAVQHIPGRAARRRRKSHADRPLVASTDGCDHAGWLRRYHGCAGGGGLSAGAARCSGAVSGHAGGGGRWQERGGKSAAARARASLVLAHRRRPAPPTAPRRTTRATSHAWRRGSAGPSRAAHGPSGLGVSPCQPAGRRPCAWPRCCVSAI